ncbi:MAG: hypothetical protein Q8N18_13270 [Opitutaceae bacterium]|nr:hypothetical protein [Opitutaceae bacterium]
MNPSIQLPSSDATTRIMRPLVLHDVTNPSASARAAALRRRAALHDIPATTIHSRPHPARKSQP